MSDEITGTLGHEAENAVVGKRNQQTRNQLSADPSQNLYFSNPDNLQLYLYLTSMAGDIRDLTVKLDDLPNRVGNLEVARLEVARTAITTAQAAATLASQTALAAAHLAETKLVNPAPVTSWIIIGLLVVAVGIGLFFVARTF